MPVGRLVWPMGAWVVSWVSDTTGFGSIALQVGAAARVGVAMSFLPSVA